MPDERTEIYLLYDDDALYVARAALRPRARARSRRTTCARTTTSAQDDRFYVTIDPFNDAAQRLLLRLESERRARRRPLSQRHGVLRRLGQHLRRASAGRFEGGWIAEYRDSVQVDLVRSEDGHLGAQLLARRRAQEREHRLGVAQPRATTRRSRGSPSASKGSSTASGSTSCRRPAVRETQALRRPASTDTRLRAVARPGLQDHAAAERLADVQHGLLGDRGRRPAGESHALRLVLPREARLLPARGRHLRVRPHRRAAGQHLASTQHVARRTAGRSSRGASA